MRTNSSPLEYLTAFAIVFGTGFLSAACFVAYVERVRRSAVRDHCTMPMPSPATCSTVEVRA